MLPADDAGASPPLVAAPRRPICGLVIAGCAGVAAGLAVPVEALLLLAAGGVCVLAALLCRARAAADMLLVAGAVCAGWAHAGLAVHSPSGREVAAVLVRPAEYVRVIGEVRAAPAVRRDERSGENLWTFPVRLEGLQRVRFWQRVTGEVEVQLRLPPAQPSPRFGERWQWQGLLGPQLRWRAGAQSPAGYRLLADGMGAERLALATVSVRAACLAAREFFATLLSRGLEQHPGEAGLLRAMLLGTREDMDEALFQDFSVTGTLHIVAVSGTHVAMLSLFLLALLRGAGVTQPFWFYWLAPLLTLYVMMTGLAPSAIRAGLMAVMFWLAPLLQRKPDGLTALAWSALLILAWEPAQWRDIGFQLSFAAVLGLVLIYPPLARHTHGWLRGDAWRLQLEPWWQRWPRWLVRSVALLALTSVSVCLVTDPLTARYFNLLSPVALLANIAVVPAAGLMMALGLLAMLGGALWAPLADLCNHLNLPVITLIMRCTEWSAALPGGHFYLRSPAWGWIAVYYVGLGLLLVGTRRVRVAVTVTGLLIGGVLLWRAAHDQTLAVHIWRLGGATVTLVDAPCGDKVLVNTGPRHVQRDLLRRLRAEGVGALRALALTRGNREQAGGAGDLLQHMQVRELWRPTGGLPADVEALALHGQLQVRALEAGFYAALAGQAEWEAFHPAVGTKARRSAARAPVFRLSRSPVAVLFLSGAGGGALAQLQAGREWPSATVAVADQAEALEAVWLRQLGVREVITPATFLREAQDRQGLAARQGLQLWCLEEGDTLHIVWPVATNPAARVRISQDPWRRAAPTAF